MGGQVIHDDDIAWLEGWHQDLLDISEEGGGVHGAIEHHGCCHAFQAERADKGCGLPMAVRDWRATALATARASIAPGHFGRGPGLIDKHQLFGIEIGLGLEPSLATARNVRPLLLAGVCGFF